MKGDLKESEINKTILKKINNEASILGKEKLIVDQILFLSKRISNKRIREKVITQTLFFYIELYKMNHRLHEAIITELKKDAVLLKRRIDNKLKKKHVYENIFYKLRGYATRLAKESQQHLRMYHAATSNKRAHLRLTVKSVSRLFKVYNILKSEDNILHFRKILLLKTLHMFKEMLELSNKNAKLIAHNISMLEKNRFGKQYKEVVLIVNNQIKYLHNFALNFNNYIIHNEPFYANGKKHILITHKVKPVF